MLGKPEVRDLQLADIYRRHGLRLCLSQLAPVELSDKSIEDLYFDRQHTGMRTLVAICDDLIIGTATMILEQKFIHNGGKVAHIEDVAVIPEYQGFGVGKLLIGAIIELARIARCYKVVLNCSKQLEAFYNKFGFQRHPHGNMRLQLL